MLRILTRYGQHRLIICIFLRTIHENVVSLPYDKSTIRVIIRLQTMYLYAGTRIPQLVFFFFMFYIGSSIFEIVSAHLDLITFSTKQALGFYRLMFYLLYDYFCCRPNFWKFVLARACLSNCW